MQEVVLNCQQGGSRVVARGGPIDKDPVLVLVSFVDAALRVDDPGLVQQRSLVVASPAQARQLRAVARGVLLAARVVLVGSRVKMTFPSIRQSGGPDCLNC